MYNNGQLAQSTVSNVSDYLDAAYAKLTLGASYTFYLDSTGRFFRAEPYMAPVPKPVFVFFVKAFTIPGQDTVNEYGQAIPGQSTNYVQCVSADGEIVNYVTGTDNSNLERGVMQLAFDNRGNAVLSAASSNEIAAISGGNYRTAITQFPDTPYCLAEDAKVIELSPINPQNGTAELSNLKVSTAVGSVKGNYSGVRMYAVLTNNGTIPNIWIDGAAMPSAEPVRPVPDSYIYVTDARQVGSMLLADGRTVAGTYNVYLDGVKTEIAMPAAPVTGFFAYTVQNDVYTLSAINSQTVSAKVITLDGKAAGTTLYNGGFSSIDSAIDGKSIAGMTVCDLRPVAPAKLITDVAGLENLTEPLTLTTLMTSTGAFTGGVIYVSY